MTRTFLLATLYLTILATPIYTQCTDGCLLCEKIDANSSKCTICDSFASYVPFGEGLCFKLEVENCLIPTTDRATTKCLACKDGTIYDTTTHKCKEVAKKIEKCVKYDDKAACYQCEANHYLEAGACKQVTTPIENCGMYSSDGLTCVSCSMGYYKNPFDGKCLKITGATNCLAYTRASCNQCQVGYVINNNLTLNKPLTVSVLQQFVSALVAKTQLKQELIINLPVDNCQKGIITNCIKYETFDKCTACNSGYLLSQDGTTCDRFPEEPLANCQIYSSATVCSKCVNGAYRDTNNACVIGTVVPNCFIYSQTENKCDECEYGFYLDGTSCKKRESSLNVIQCKVYNKTKDECQECNPNFILSSNKLFCVTGVVNCKDHTITNNTATCTKCIDGYGLNGGQCQGLSTAECLKYVGETNVCEECNPNYYVDSVTKKCLENTALHCKEKNKNENLCVECLPKFWSDNGVCKIQNIQNCVSYNTNVNTCATCAFAYYVTTSPLGQCAPSTAKFCTKYDANEDSCEICQTGYYPDASHADKCRPQSLTGCKNYTLNQNECTLCQDDHFPDPTPQTLCRPQTGVKNNCDKYTAMTDKCLECELGFYESGDQCTTFDATGCTKQIYNQNKCETCDNLYYKDNNEQCQELGVINCIKNDPSSQQSECQICDKTKILASITSCADRNSSIPIDPLCNGNKNGTDNGSCNVCTDSNHTAFFSDKYDASSLLPNCAKFNGTTGACEQCAPFYGSNCATLENDKNCKQKITAGIAESLATAGKCAECREKDINYLDTSADSGTCKPRLMKDKMNCHQYEEASSACKTCNEGSAYSLLDKFVTCAPKLSTEVPAGNVAVANCDAWTEDLSVCRACKSNKKGDDCTTNLTTTNGTFQNFFDKDFDILTYGEGTATVNTNCATTNQYGPYMPSDGGVADIGCVSCADNHLKVLSTYSDPNYTFASMSYEKGATHPFPETVVTIAACHDETDKTGFAQDYTPRVPGANPGDPDISPDTAKAFTFDFTNVSDLLNTKNGKIAARCKKTFRPTWETIEWNATTTRLDDDTKRDFYNATIVSCAADPGDFVKPLKRYHGLEYGFKKVNGVNLNALLYYDSCVLSTDLFVFVGKQENSSKEIFFSKIGAGDTHELCISPTISDGTAHEIIANCQIHFHEGTDNVFTAKQNFGCLACKPGFKPTFKTHADDKDKLIEKCEPITNCDTTNEANNTWLNACEKCMNGYSWTLENGEFLPDYSTCTSTTKSNCLFRIDNADTCVFCKPGYLADSSGNCVEWKIHNCDKLGMPPVKKIRADNSFSKNTILSYTQMTAFLNFQYIGDANKDLLYSRSGCVQCASTHYRLTSDATNVRFCTGSLADDFFSSDLISECVKYSVSTPKKCAQCVDGKVYDEVAGNCIAEVTTTKNCLSKNATGCTVCKSGHPPKSNVCPAYENCAEVDPTSLKCARCEDLHRPKTGSEDFDCEPRDSTDICKSYDHMSVCLECDDNTKSPVTFVDTNDKGYRTVCVAKYDDGAANKKALAASNSYIIKPTGTTFETKMKVYKVYNSSLKYNVTGTFMDSFVGSVCISSPTTANCSKYDEFRECDECNPGYIKNSTTKQCDEGTVNDCIKYENNECKECQSEFYLSGTGANAVCKPRFKKNCENYYIAGDFCTSCLNDSFFTETNANPSYGTCSPYSVTDCKEKNPNADECSSCETNVRYLDANDKKCKLYTKQFCKEFSTSEDKCITECHSNRYLSPSTFECELYTVTNCKGANEKAADKCTDCQNYFYMDNGKCLPPTTTNCADLNPTVDKCNTCNTGYWKNSSEKCELNTAANCKVKATDSNKCTSCLNIHYKDADDNDICKPHTAKECETYSETKNQCATCVTGFYLKIDGDNQTCEPNGSKHCSVKSKTANECVTCDSDFYLNSSKQCQEITNSTCKTLAPNSNDCATCATNKYIDSATKECMANTVVPNCKTYSLNSDTCDTCQPGYYKSTDSKTCIINPNGIAGCVRYSNLSTCDACKNTHYLKDNKCVLFNVDDAIGNCKEYSGLKICSKCDSNFSLFEGACSQNIATGCTTWKDKDNCETCPQNAVLGTGNPKNCNLTTITGCEVVTGTVGAEVCTQCNSTTFLKDNKCETITKPVVGCLVYEADGFCKTCPANQAVAADGQSCKPIDSSLLGDKCTLGTLGDVPKCAICDEGFLMNSEGQCNNECKVTNCMLCNPMNSEKCNLCKTGFHMNAELLCVENQQSTTNASVGRFNGVFGSLLILLLFMVFRIDL